MHFLDINTISPTKLSQLLSRHHTIVACLCAAWCDACSVYRTKFEALSKQYPELIFLWIDIEDQADLVGDFAIENFPTLLIQQHEIVTFYGTMQPDTTQLKRVIQSQTKQTLEQLRLQADSSKQRRLWQVDANLLARLTQRV